MSAYRLSLSPPDKAQVQIGTGELQLRWQALAQRQVTLMCLPRLRVRLRVRVRYQFDGVSDGERTAFMRPFDLYTQRGGG